MRKSLIALALAGVVDAVSYMVVAPSIVFYVLQSGGTLEQYGLILSSFSFASFCTKPFLGWWSDRIGGFRVPYICSLLIATLGGLLYVAASALPSDKSSGVRCILASRLMGGVGAANSALAYAYVARTVPQQEQTSVNSLLSMTRLLGMAVGPGVNAFLAWVNVPLFHGKLTLDPLNSVGLILAITNLVALACIVFLLEDPPKQTEKKDRCEGEDDKSSCPIQGKTSTKDVIMAILSAEILVPFLSIFSFNASFQLIETGFAPAAGDALGWGPVQTSTVLGLASIIIMAGMALVSVLSSKCRVTDPVILSVGLLMSIAGYTSIYLCWRIDVSGSHAFWLPMMFSAGAFPFLAAPTRSVFTKGVDSMPALDDYHGTMQACLSMGASVAGFIVPGLVATYCLRTPEEVRAVGSDGREFTKWSLVAPALSALTLCGVIYVQVKTGGCFVASPTSAIAEEDEYKTTQVSNGDAETEGGATAAVNEATRLLPSETPSSAAGAGRKKKQRRDTKCPWNDSDDPADRYKYSPQVAMHRGSACECMGLSQPSTHGSFKGRTGLLNLTEEEEEELEDDYA